MRMQSHEDCRPVLLIRYKPTDRAVDVLRSVPTFSFKCHCKDNILYLYCTHENVQAHCTLKDGNSQNLLLHFK